MREAPRCSWPFELLVFSLFTLLRFLAFGFLRSCCCGKGVPPPVEVPTSTFERPMKIIDISAQREKSAGQLQRIV